MGPNNRGLLPLAAALFALACAGAKAPQPDGAIGKPDLVGDLQRIASSEVARSGDCVDLAWNAYPIRGGAGLWNGRIYVFWEAAIGLAETSIRTDGSGLSTTKRQGTGPVTGAGTHDGQFLAGARDGQVFSVLTGALADPQFSKTSFEIPAAIGITPAVDFVAWDGEAFNMELDSVDKSTWAVRLNPDGSVKLPPTKYGLMLDSSSEGYDLGYKISTNATSGVTYLFSATYPRNITGHTRDGKRLAWIPAEGVLTLPLYSGPPYDSMGISSSGGATRPAVSTDDQGGAWISWDQSTNRTPADLLGIQHIAADGAFGPTIWFGEIGSMAYSLLARDSESALLVFSNGHGLYTCDVNGDKISPPRHLTEQQPAGSGDLVDYREMQLLADGTTDWLVMQQGTQRTVAVRVLKIAPGCVYPTYPTELLAL
jgi:hypothetical protein